MIYRLVIFADPSTIWLTKVMVKNKGEGTLAYVPQQFTVTGTIDIHKVFMGAIFQEPIGDMDGTAIVQGSHIELSSNSSQGM